jgi:hypothetical protein
MDFTREKLILARVAIGINDLIENGSVKGPRLEINQELEQAARTIILTDEEIRGTLDFIRADDHWGISQKGLN